MSEAFFERRGAQAIVAWILMQDRRKQKSPKEAACRFIGQSGAESLAVSSDALSISGKIIVRLRDTGVKSYPANGKRISFILHEQSKLSTRRERKS
jgi:hypothetical protein